MSRLYLRLLPDGLALAALASATAAQCPDDVELSALDGSAGFMALGSA